MTKGVGACWGIAPTDINNRKGEFYTLNALTYISALRVWFELSKIYAV